ncbi:MAG: hypothetical protein NTX64_15120, partial [Elusimicrobia bacterium]|nr:hypothetical protein [Elusimicrobiota bacterium]
SWTKTTLLSLANHTGSMNDVMKLRFPTEVTVRLVTPLPADGTGQNFHGLVEPVNSWYSIELAKGEPERLWGFLKQPGDDARKLDYGYGPLRWNQGLQQLWLTLERCSLFPAHEPELRAAAQSSTLEEFKARYDTIIGEIVDTFHGAHTDFMWNDSTFMPWLSRTLADWQ